MPLSSFLTHLAILPCRFLLCFHTKSAERHRVNRAIAFENACLFVVADVPDHVEEEVVAAHGVQELLVDMIRRIRRSA